MDLLSKFLPACQKFRQITVGEREGIEIPSRLARVLNYIRMEILARVVTTRARISVLARVINFYVKSNCVVLWN